jgi:hypothetical protein
MTETLTDVAKRHAVIVAQGSGVLIQPAIEDYSYVLTAKHVVKDFDNVNKIKISSMFDDDIVVLDRLIHPEFDVAILKVPKQEGLALIRYSLDLKQEEDLMIYGYPKRKRGKETTLDKLDSYGLTVHEIRVSKLVIRNNETANYADIEGFSGGALFKLDEHLNIVFVVGIENQMDDDDALHGRVCGIPIYIYADYLVENGWAALEPLHLVSFKYCQEGIFKTLVLQRDENLSCLRQFLKLHLDGHKIEEFDVITPREIITRFEKRLLAHKQIVHALHRPEFWVWFLEFLSIQLLLSPPQRNKQDWEAEYLDDVFGSFRFIHAHENVNHKQIFSQLILPTDLTGMSAECKIVVFTNGDLPPLPILNTDVQKKTLVDISQGLNGKANISVVDKNRAMTNVIIHWPKLNDCCLADYEEKFSEFNILENKQDIYDLVIHGYGEVLKDDY